MQAKSPETPPCTPTCSLCCQVRPLETQTARLLPLLPSSGPLGLCATCTVAIDLARLGAQLQSGSTEESAFVQHLGTTRQLLRAAFGETLYLRPEADPKPK